MDKTGSTGQVSGCSPNDITSFLLQWKADSFYGIFCDCTLWIFVQCHTQTCLTALHTGLPGWAGTRKVKPVWILLKQETVSGSGISWAICKSASRSRQITTPAPHCSVFTGRMPFLPPNQQCQSTEDNSAVQYSVLQVIYIFFVLFRVKTLNCTTAA